MKRIFKLSKLYIFVFILNGLFTSGCKKFIEVNPPVTSITGASVFSTDANATSVLTGIYTKISKGGSTGVGEFNSLSYYVGLSADEFRLYGGVTSSVQLAYYRNQLSITSGSEFWNVIYPYIFTCNSAIEELSKATTLTSKVKDQLIGESKFMRAFFYFYLVNLYGDVPLVLSTDFTKNSFLARSSKSDVYQQIISDLNDAQTFLSSSYLKSDLLTTTTERVRPTKWAANALLARAYLYNGDYSKAEEQASVVINNTGLYSLSSLNNVFLKNSSEAIWQLQPVNVGWNTEDARIFVLSSSPVGVNTSHPVYLGNSFISSFDTSDNRKKNWVATYTDISGSYYYANKYKIATNGAAVSEYTMVLRLAEQYLIRAEARAQLNKINESKLDLDIIRQRAGLNPTTANDKTSLLTSVLNERRLELFTEWGHRWFDLKRTGNIEPVMAIVTPEKANGESWKSHQQLYPIPSSDINNNLNLKQNSGY